MFPGRMMRVHFFGVPPCSQENVVPCHMVQSRRRLKKKPWFSKNDINGSIHQFCKLFGKKHATKKTIGLTVKEKNVHAFLFQGRIFPY